MRFLFKFEGTFVSPPDANGTPLRLRVFPVFKDWDWRPAGSLPLGIPSNSDVLLI